MRGSRRGHREQRRGPGRGTVLIAVVVALVMLQVVLAAVVVSGSRDLDVSGRRIESARAFYAAEAGINMALRELAENDDEDGDGTIGGVSDDGGAGNDPELSGGRVHVTADKVGATTTLVSLASSGECVRRVEARAEDTAIAQSFIGTGIGTTYVTFAQLRTGFTTFIGATTGLIDFTAQGAGEIVTNQYTVSHGVTFSNTVGTHGARIESGTVVDALDGYDGTFKANGDRLYASQPNTSAASPFTIVFTNPMGRVGMFLGMGPQGATATFTVRVFDAGNVELGAYTVRTAAWADAAEREGFFGYQGASANIKRVTILNNSATANADMMILDHLIWSATPSAVLKPRQSGWAELLAAP